MKMKYTKTDVHLAWLAGFMEGDGCYQISVKPNQLKISAMQSIKNRLNINAMMKVLDENDIKYKHYVFKNQKYPQDGVYVYRKEECKKFLELTIPFMLGEKKNQAKMALEFIRGNIDAKTANQLMKKMKTRSYEGKRGGRPHSKLPKSEWENIQSRLDLGDKLQDIADDYDVSKQAIWYLKHNHLKNKKD